MWSSTSTTRPSHWLLPFVLSQHLGNLTHFYGCGSRYISAVFSKGTATWWITFCHWYHLISHVAGRNSIDHTASVFFPAQLRFNRACLCLRLLATSRCAGCEVENQHTAGAPLDFIQHGGKSLCCLSVLYGRRAPCSAGPSRPPKWHLFGKVKELGRTGMQKSIQVMMHQYLSQRHGPTGLDTSEFGWERSSGQAGKRMFQKLWNVWNSIPSAILCRNKAEHDIIQCWALWCKNILYIVYVPFTKWLNYIENWGQFHKSC